MRFYIALYIAKLCACLIRIIARNRGTNLPGEIALKIDPLFVAHVKGLDPAKAVFITGTNGKSTSTNMIHHILTHAGHSVCSNLKGANLLTGVATALLSDCSLSGRLESEYVVMETDERYLKMIRAQLPARFQCVTNIQKDQAQRNGEPSFILRKVAEALDPSVILFANIDDPNTLSLSSIPDRSVYYGVAENSKSFRKDDDFFSVGMPCPKCHNPITFHTYNIDNIGPFECSCCGFGSDRASDYLATDIRFEDKTFRVGSTTYAFHFNTPYFLYCYTLAIAVATEFGLTTVEISAALDAFSDIRGRIETRNLAGKTVHYIKVKQENSETVQSALNLASQDQREKVFMIGYDEYLDFYPPMLLNFYPFDYDTRGLLKSNVDKCICMSEAMGRACAVRFLYDGFKESDMIVLPNSREATIAEALSNISTADAYLIEEVPYWKK